MAKQYFERRPASRSKRFEFSATVRGIPLSFASDAGVFSRRRVDRGTLLLAESIEVRPGERVLDLGCGLGVLGIAVARATAAGHVWMTDVNERATALARENAKRNGVERRVTVRSGPFYAPVAGLAFDHVATNPPIRAGRATVARMIDEAPGHLLAGGSFWLVARTRQGARALETILRHRFGDASVVARGAGYRVVRCQREETIRPASETQGRRGIAG